MQIKRRRKQHIYEVISVKFFQKLETLYGNTEILYKIRDIEKGRLVTEGKKNQI